MWERLSSLLAELLPGWVKAKAVLRHRATTKGRAPGDGDRRMRQAEKS